MACASIDRMTQFTPGNLCSIIWAASKLKKDVAQSGMFKSFLKTWASELEAHLDDLDLDQIRKVMSAITRVGFAPGANWKLKMEAALTRRLAGCVCPRTLACCLVSAASLGLALHPSLAFREAVSAACDASFAEERERRVGAAAAESAGGEGGGRAAARCACSALWAVAVLGVPLGEHTVQVMLSHVTSAGPPSPAPGASTGPAAAAARLPSLPSVDLEGPNAGSSAAGLTSLDVAQVLWALSKLRHVPRAGQLAALLAATAPLLPAAQPELLATILWALADLEVVPPATWLELAYSSFERQLQRADVEPLQALLHAAATLQLPAPQWSERLMERLQDVELRPLPDGNVVDLVMSMHALALHPPPQLAHRLQQECLKRLAMRNAAAAAGAGAEAGDAPAASRVEAAGTQAA